MDTPDAATKRKLSQSGYDSTSSPHAIKRPSTVFSNLQATIDPFVAGNFSSFNPPWNSLTDAPLAPPLGEAIFQPPLGETSFHAHQTPVTSVLEQNYCSYNTELPFDFDQLDPGIPNLDIGFQTNNDTTTVLMPTASHYASSYTFPFDNDGTALPDFSSNYLPCLKDTPVDGMDGIQTALNDESIEPSQASNIVPALAKTPRVFKDTCFGVIVAQVPISTDIPKAQRAIDIDLRQWGNLFKMYSKETNTYTGILSLPGLDKLVEWPTVQLKASIIQSAQDIRLTHPKRTTKPSRSKETTNLKTVDCRILVSGSRAEGNGVGLALSDASLFLQHPYAEEVQGYLTYWNPHILVRPDGTMPKLEHLSLSPSSSTNREQSLSETEKCRILRIFNSANGPPIVPVSFEPSPRLQSKPMRHQLHAIAMMMEKESKMIDDLKFRSLWIPEDSPQGLQYRHILTGTTKKSPVHVCGGILADEMGLGKTLSTLALICSSLDGLECGSVGLKGGETKATLIVTPKSTTVSWKQQIHQHIHSNRFSYILYHGNNKQKAGKGFKGCDVVLTTYETLMSDLKSKGPLISAVWLRVVLDEAHHIRNRSTQCFQAACELRARYRWCLTGTPIQNSVDDYGALLSFIRVPFLTTKAHYDKHVAVPIRKQDPYAFNRLRDLIDATCLRRTKATAGLEFGLPSKSERVEDITLDRDDQELYARFQKIAEDEASRRSAGHSNFTGSQGRNILSLITILRRICDHGKHMVPERAFNLLEADSNGTARNDSPLTGIIASSCSQCGEDMDDLPTTEADVPHGLAEPMRLCTSCRAANGENDQEALPTEPNEDTSKTVTNVAVLSGVVSPSAKVRALLTNIHKYPGKSVVFTSWAAMIDMVENAFRINSIPFQRLDGKMSTSARQEAIESFKTEPQCLVILCSIGSAAEGIDLTAASQVHILEPHWNPMAEAQAIDRVHRIGQTKDVTVTRYLVKDSVEMYVKWVQDNKLRLISQSLNFAEKAEEFEKRKAEVLQKYLKAGKD